MNDNPAFPNDDELKEAAEAVVKAAAARHAGMETAHTPRGNLGPDLTYKRKFEEAKEEATAFTEWIVARYEHKISKPHPNNFNDLQTEMDGIKTAFGLEPSELADSDLDLINASSRELSKWSGAMQYSLTANYFDRLPTMVTNQARVAYYLSERAGDMRRPRRSRTRPCRCWRRSDIPAPTSSRG